jgi:enoyl-CoA hydratase/carnithine racemase
MSYQFILYDHKDGIVTLTLNRPDRLNALGDTLREELYEAMSRASDDPEVRGHRTDWGWPWLLCRWRYERCA